MLMFPGLHIVRDVRVCSKAETYNPRGTRGVSIREDTPRLHFRPLPAPETTALLHLKFSQGKHRLIPLPVYSS